MRFLANNGPRPGLVTTACNNTFLGPNFGPKNIIACWWRQQQKITRRLQHTENYLTRFDQSRTRIDLWYKMMSIITVTNWLTWFVICWTWLLKPSTSKVLEEDCVILINPSCQKFHVDLWYFCRLHNHNEESSLQTWDWNEFLFPCLFKFAALILKD